MVLTYKEGWLYFLGEKDFKTEEIVMLKLVKQISNKSAQILISFNIISAIMGRKKRILRIKMDNDLEYPIDEFTEMATKDFDFELISAERKTPLPLEEQVHLWLNSLRLMRNLLK